MSRWVNVENNFFSLPYPEERETICHYHFTYLHCARTQLNSSLTPCLPDFFPAFIFLLSWQLVHISVFCYVQFKLHKVNDTTGIFSIWCLQICSCRAFDLWNIFAGGCALQGQMVLQHVPLPWLRDTHSGNYKGWSEKKEKQIKETKSKVALSLSTCL